MSLGFESPEHYKARTILDKLGEFLSKQNSRERRFDMTLNPLDKPSVETLDDLFKNVGMSKGNGLSGGDIIDWLFDDDFVVDPDVTVDS